jgi:hypothetical protein
VEAQVVARVEAQLLRGRLVDDDLVRRERASAGDAGDPWIGAEVPGRGEVELHDLDLGERLVPPWGLEGRRARGRGQQAVDALDPRGLDRREDRVELSVPCGRDGDVDRAVLGPGGVGEGAFDHVTDDEGGRDDRRAEQRPTDDQGRLRATAADVARGHR